MSNENTPKPKPPVKVVRHAEPIKEEKKPPFVRKPHLTQRPFSNEALFAKLREQAQPNTPKTPRRASKEAK